jgi:glycosyltransferase involved in cell wall biosynthesis
MLTSPRLTIGVPVYNGGAMFEEMLRSLLDQTFTDFHIFICDNASTDNTPDIVHRYAETDSRVHYHRNDTNIGAHPNWIRSFQVAGEAPYFKWAAHDDLYAPTFLERCIEALDTMPDTVLAYTNVKVVDETGEDRLAGYAQYKRGCLEQSRDEHGRLTWLMGPLGVAEGKDVAQRFREFLHDMVACFPVFGVIRRPFMSETGLVRNYDGSDRTFLAELVLKGRFHQVREPLYINRFHASAGRLVPKEKRSAWIDAGIDGGLAPKWKQRWDLIRAPFAAGLPPAVACHCAAIVAQYVLRREAGSLARPLLEKNRSGGENNVASAAK